MICVDGVCVGVSAWCVVFVVMCSCVLCVVLLLCGLLVGLCCVCWFVVRVFGWFLVCVGVLVLVVRYCSLCLGVFVRFVFGCRGFLFVGVERGVGVGFWWFFVRCCG